MNSGPSFDQDFEEEILASCLRDAQYLAKASRLFETHNFCTEHHSWVWSTIRKVWQDYKELTSPKLLMARAREDLRREEKRVSVLELGAKLYRIKPTSPNAALDVMERWARKTSLHAAMEEAARLLEFDDQENVDKMYDILSTAVRRSPKLKSYTCTKWIEEFQQRQADRRHRKEHPGDFKRIPTGFKKIDRILGGGLEIGEFGSVMAVTGRGKSIALVNFAFNSIKHDYKAIVVSMEMAARQVNQRIDSLWLEIPYLKFKTFSFSKQELDAIEVRLKRAHKRFSGMLRVISTPIRSVNVNGLRAILDDQKQDGFVPDVLYLDSADHMLGHRRFESLRIEQTDIYWAIKALAETDGYAIWNSIQAGRDYAEKIAKAEAASEAYDKSRISDVMISLNTPKQTSRSTREVVDDLDDDTEEKVAEREARISGQLIEAFIAKARDGESGFTIPLDVDLSRMYMSELEEEE